MPAARLNRSSTVPLYQQVYEVLRAAIARGEWKPGDLLPTEAELVAHYAVSTITVRQALKALEKEGLIYRQRGRGTFVAHPTLEQSSVRIVSFTQDMPRRGFQPASKVLSARVVKAPPDIADRLQIEPGEELARLERLRLADDEPMGVEESYLIHRHCRGILSRHNYASHSLREALERDYGIRAVRARQTVRATLASRELARVLTIRPGAAVLFIERITYSQHEVPIEFLRIHYRGDRYALHSELQG